MSEYELTIEYLYKQLPFFQRDGIKAFKPGLDNIRNMCVKLGNPQERFPTIHIGGTNGKGSTSHLTSAILQCGGYKVGLYTSPHLKSFTERIKINGQEIDQQYVVSFVRDNKDLISEFQPSFFEWTLLMAFSYFADNEVDIAIIEVGLGGRLDSTNIINPLVTLITNIGLDHTDILGDTKELIAMEKSGIFKTNAGALVVDYNSDTYKVFDKKAAEVGSELLFLKPQIEIGENWRVNIHLGTVQFTLRDTQRSISLELCCGLLGEYQRDNIIGVYGIYRYLNDHTSFLVTQEAFEIGLKEVINLTNLKGRWQSLGENPLIVADTGHNLHAFEVHAKYFKMWPESKLHFILGFMKDKNIDGIMDLLPKGARYYFCEIRSNHRSCTLKDLEEIGLRFGLDFSTHSNVNEIYLDLINTLDKDCFVFIGGSTFLVAELNNL